MTRAEEAALKAYPELLSGSIFGPLPVDLNKACREKYQEGYEQAEKDLNKKPSEDLEEAAEDLFETIEIQEHENIFEDTFKKIFIAGAEWMRKKDVEDMYMSDNRHFLKCYEQGKVDMRVEMMKDTVEGEIGYWNQRGLSIRLDQSLDKLGYDEDTKVKIIIVKK